jgi:hypothetical protein
MHGGEPTVQQRHERHERDEHRDDIEHQVQPLARPPRRGVEQVHVLLGHVELDGAVRLGRLGLRLEQLRHHDGAGRGHDHRGQEVPRLDPERDVSFALCSAGVMTQAASLTGDWSCAIRRAIARISSDGIRKRSARRRRRLNA